MADNRGHMAGFEDFDRYRSGEMSSREQHAFEKRMLEDPMLAEAYEGFVALQDSNADLREIKNKLNENLNSRINARPRRTVPLWMYGAAASLLITLGTIWLTFINNPHKGALKETGQKVAEEPLMERQPATAQAIGEKAAPAPAAKKQQTKTPSAAPPASEKTLTDHATDMLSETAPRVASADHEEIATVPAQDERRSLVDSPDTRVAATGASQLRREPRFKKSENVVTEATSRRQLAPLLGTVDSLNNQAPRPLIGWESYNAYLRQQTHNADRSGDVVVHFTVNADGSLLEFEAQGKKQLRDEAIRIVRSGPAWVPGKQNGTLSDKRASVTLRFKKDPAGRR